ncbi:MAG TPA: serine/threonine-protein kinase [Polyangiaceae bacterium]|nr:serine/threonine-protein kinase [Polyangiaceae bacterium]
MKDPIAGQTLGRYELLVPIAKGGMAQVWAARLRGTRGFQKIFAIKTILAGAMDDSRMERMFLQEATLASQIHHPNVVTTIELGEDEGILYLVMEWVDGESLKFIMSRAAQRGNLPLPIAVNLIGQACKGLHAAHDLRDESGTPIGVVHRDVSAQNVLVTYSGSAKLVDFGIAKATAGAAGVTQAGEIKGKFAYMAPEQVTGDVVDRRTDIFGMGVILYLLTTGRHPFKGVHTAETLQNICSKRPPRAPSSIIPGYPPELEAVVLKSLAKDPNDRWATANDVLSALERAMPQSLDGSFEVQVADYMNELLGDRVRERRMQLRVAQEQADRARPEGMSSPGSYGSLRALTVGAELGTGTGTHSSSAARLLLDPRVMASLPGFEAAPPSRWRRTASVVGVALGAVTLFALGQFVHWGPPGASGNAVAPALAPAVPVAPPPVEIVAAPPVAAIAPTAAPTETAEERRETAPGRKGVVVLRKGPTGPTARPNNPTSQPASSSAPPAPAPENRTQNHDVAAPNSWDPGSFGGRR